MQFFSFTLILYASVTSIIGEVRIFLSIWIQPSVQGLCFVTWTKATDSFKENYKAAVNVVYAAKSGISTQDFNVLIQGQET